MKIDIHIFGQQDFMRMEGETHLPSANVKSIPLIKGMSLYDALRISGISFGAPCAGNGTCGACKIKVLEGELEITAKDRELLCREELEAGFRLACQAYPKKSCSVAILKKEFVAVTNYQGNEECLGESVVECSQMLHKEYAIAIDLGTTTLAYELFSIKTGRIIKTGTSVNPQRIYGADVITRMEQSDNGRREMLKQVLRQTMKKDMARLLEDIEIENVRSVAISGNTAMVHLFMGYPCEGLDRYPFHPVTLNAISSDALTLQLMDIAIPVQITAGISAYVGGDILAGLGSQDILSEEKPCLFLDLGTNVEMALFNGKDKIYVTSAPAGPAFEAVNISCGVPGVKGAISAITISGGKQTIQTIGEKEAIGFCGSGILEAIYELLKNHFMDETGLLSDAYFEKGYPVGKFKITQNDIRQIQLAKSAVFSAITILLQRAGLRACDVEKIYLAGGFGFHLNIEKAIGIGLFPSDFWGKIQPIGNASLHGTKQILRKIVTEKELSKVVSSCEEIYLANEKEFQNFFMDNMNFHLLADADK